MNNSLNSNSQIQSLENIKVAIRVRPFLKSEQSNENIIFTDSTDDRKIQLMKSENCFEGYYDKIYTARNSQDDIFKFVKDSIEDVLSGINSTIFTYGQTGSGKTYTMFGSDWTLNEESEIYSQVKANLAYDKHDFIK
jgi:hypothetical protein